MMEVMMGKLLRISDAVVWLSRVKGINYTRQALYKMICEGQLPYVQRADVEGSGRVRPGGRIMLDQADLEALFVHHPVDENR
jgi:hypothetical protein